MSKNGPCEYEDLDQTKPSFQRKKRHANQKSKDDKKKCDQCEYKACKQSLQEHKLSVHEGKIIMCEKRDKTFARKWGLRRHIVFKHEGYRVKCDQCEFKAQDNTTIKKHKMSMHEGKMIKCDKCDKQFSFIRGKTYLAKHI